METKKLYRSRSNRMIAGVCSGLAEYFNIDPTIVRVLFVVFGLTGSGVLAYIVALLIMPEAPG